MSYHFLFFFSLHVPSHSILFMLPVCFLWWHSIYLSTPFACCYLPLRPFFAYYLFFTRRDDAERPDLATLAGPYMSLERASWAVIWYSTIWYEYTNE
ncbi:hypothetical protein BDW67DRAFT_105426 [Aspergillus spinulosporus]